MQSKFYLAAAGLCLLATATVHAANFEVNPQAALQNVYLQNKGQIVDQDGLPCPDVKYIYNGDGFKLYLRDSGFSYEWFTESPASDNMSEAGPTKKEDEDDENDVPFKYLSERVDIYFQHANRQAEITPGQQQPFYINYYTNYTGASGITHITSYAEITYSNLYPGIDMVFSLQKGKDGTALPKYEFVCHKGSRPSDISLLYKGDQKMKITSNGALNILCDLGALNESRPILLDEEGNKLNPISFHVNRNEITFSNQRGILQQEEIIDPTLDWGTYIGGPNKEVPDEIVVDKFQNVIISTRTNSTTGIATLGAYKTTYAGGDDIGLIKFDNNGNIVWGTYYGGKGNDVGFAVTADTLKGNIFVGGRTSSTSGVATPGAVIDTFSGGYFDVILAMFSAGGFLRWGTYMGGPGRDDVQGLCADQYGNVIAAGYTESLWGIATPNAFSMKGDTIGKVFLMKFDSTGHQIYGTYYGGNNCDRGHGIAVDAQGYIYEDGTTQSKKNFATPGAFQTTLGGGNDAFVMKWSPSGHPIWCTYYGGSGDERGRDLRLDNACNLYFMGQTESYTNIATSGEYKTQLTTGQPVNRDGYLVKFDSSGHRLWGTYYGGNNIEMPRALQVNPPGAPIYIAGYTKSDSGVATPGAYNVDLGGGNDAFFNIFNYDGSKLLYQTYYGGKGSESVNSGGWYGETLDVDSSGDVFLNGPTKSTDSIATQGSFKDTLSYDSIHGTQFDIFLAKFGQICVDAFEPNDSISHCPQLVFGTNSNKLKISAQLGYAGDKDYYRFDVNQTLDSVVVNLTNITVNADLYIVNSSGKILDSSKHKQLNNEKIVKKNPVAGTYYVFIKAHTAGDYDANDCYTLTLNQYKNAGINKAMASANSSFTVYPNPAHDETTINVEWNVLSYSVDICDLTGKVLRSVSRINSGANDKFIIPLTHLASGTYLIKLYSALGEMVKPLVVE